MRSFMGCERSIEAPVYWHFEPRLVLPERTVRYEIDPAARLDVAARCGRAGFLRNA